jgi:hypothetical protein
VETLLAQESAVYGRNEEGKIMDYSEYLLRINRLMQETHKAASVNNYEAASNMAAEVARYAISLAAMFESKTETEI